MSRFIRSNLRVLIFYALGYYLTYPILFILFFTFRSRYFYFALCAILAVCGFVFWILTHAKKITLQKVTFRNIKPEIYKEYGRQLVGVVILCIISCLIEIFHLWHYGMGYYNFLCLFFDEELAHYLSNLAIPDPGLLYFIAVSLFYLFYNIARLLFDHKLYQES